MTRVAWACIALLAGAGTEDGSGDQAEDLDKRIAATFERDLKIAEWLESSSDSKPGAAGCVFELCARGCVCGV